jgi:heptosyltransferase-3
MMFYGSGRTRVAASSLVGVDEKIDSVLVVLTRQIGDVLLSTPLIRAARERWPGARIDVMGFAGTLAVLRGNPDVNAFVEVRQGEGWRQSWPLLKWLWRRYDLALICEFSDRAHLYGLIAARKRAGQVAHQWTRSWWKRLLLSHAAGFDSVPAHLVLEKLKVIAPWAPPRPLIELVPPAAKALPPDLQARLEPKYVVVHAPSLVRYKQWPVAHYAQVVGALARRGIQVVLTGSGSEADRRCTAEVARGADSPRVFDQAGSLDFGQLVTLLRGAALYLGPDTSITHLAAACGTPIVALFGPSDPRQWGPWPRGSSARQPYVRHQPVQREGRVILLQGPQPCVPCRQSGCERHDASRSECLETMTPERVLAQIDQILDVPAPAPAAGERLAGSARLPQRG